MSWVKVNTGGGGSLPSYSGTTGVDIADSSSSGVTISEAGDSDITLESTTSGTTIDSAGNAWRFQEDGSILFQPTVGSDVYLYTADVVADLPTDGWPAFGLTGDGNIWFNGGSGWVSAVGANTTSQVLLTANINNGLGTFEFTSLTTDYWVPTSLPPSGTDVTVTALCSPSVGGLLFGPSGTNGSLANIPTNDVGILQVLNIYVSDITGTNVFKGHKNLTPAIDVTYSAADTTGLTTDLLAGTDLTYDSVAGTLVSTAGSAYMVTIWMSCGWND